jgi:hypothetical protein
MGRRGPDAPTSGQANNSDKVSDTHSVGSVGNDNLGVFTITKITVKITNTVPPTHLVPRTPNMTYMGLQRRCSPGASLTRLTRLAGW